MVDDSSVDWEKMEQDAAGASSPIPGFRTEIITQAMLTRRMLWDTIPCTDVPAVAKYLGLPPTSPEVAGMEHDQSHDRTAAVAAVLPYVEMMSSSTAAGIAAAMIVDAEGLDEDEVTSGVESEEFQDMSGKLSAVIYMAAWGIVAELVDINALHLPHHVVTSSSKDTES